MKLLLRLAGATLAIGVAIAAPLTASASTQDRFSITGSGAEATFSNCSSVTDQVCSDISMAVSSVITTANGSTSSETTLSISITKYSVDSTGGLTFISEAAGFGPA